MEINIDISITSAAALTSVSSQNKQFEAFSATLEHFEIKLCTLGKSRIEGKSLTEGVHELGLVGYAKEVRITELRIKIRESVLYDLGTTPKKYSGLRNGIEKLHGEWSSDHVQIDKLLVRADFLDVEIEIEVERRLQEHLSAEAMSGEMITNTLAYSCTSMEYRSSLMNLTTIFNDFTDSCREFIKELKGDIVDEIRKSVL